MSTALPSMGAPSLLQAFAAAQVQNRDAKKKYRHNEKNHVFHCAIPLSLNTASPAEAPQFRALLSSSAKLALQTLAVRCKRSMPTPVSGSDEADIRIL
jgi:hypothetical protein